MALPAKKLRPSRLTCLSGVLMLSLTNLSEGQPYDKSKKTRILISQGGSPMRPVLEFAVLTRNSINPTLNAPWSLSLHLPEGISLPRKEFSKSDLDLNKGFPRFMVPLSMKKGPTGGYSLSYRLTSFTCTKDKKQCFREVHTGSFIYHPP